MKKFRSVVVFLLFLLILSKCIPTQNPKLVDMVNTFQPMSKAHILGTDNLGRDIFSLMVTGFQRTLTVLVSASFIGLVPGVFLGILSAYKGGLTSLVVRFFVDLGMIVPSFIAALILTASIGVSPLAVGVALGICDIGTYANQAEALSKKVLGEEFVVAESLLGISTVRLIAYHILPSVLGPSLTLLGARAGNVILSYASLTFIGLGSDITSPDWGTMLYQYRVFIVHKPSLLLWPSLGILSLSLLFYFVFDNWRLGDKERGHLYE